MLSSSNTEGLSSVNAANYFIDIGENKTKGKTLPKVISQFQQLYARFFLGK